MSNQADAYLVELTLEKYAAARGLNVEEVKKKWAPALNSTPKKDALTQKLASACSTLASIKEVGKGLDPNTQKVLSELSTLVVTRALDKSEEESPDEDAKLLSLIRRVKVLDHAFEDPDKVSQDIAEKVSKEISGSLAEALTSLQETLETIAPKVRAEPEAARSPEFLELQQTLENVNTTLVKLADKISNDGAPRGEVETDVETMMSQISTATERAKGFLVKQGYTIAAEGTPATLDEAKKIVEAQGFTLQDQRVSRVDAERMAKEAAETEHKKHEDDLELKLEERKIEAAEKVVGTAIDKVMEPFKYFLEKYLDTAVGEVPIPEASSVATSSPVAPASAPPTPPPPTLIRIEGPPPQPEVPKSKVTRKHGR